MQQISQGLARSASTLLHLILILTILFFVFGVLGVAFFGHMCLRGQDETSFRCLLLEPSNLIPPHTSFSNIGTAFLTLFRVASGDKWARLANIYGMNTLASPRVPNYMDLAVQGIHEYRSVTSEHLKARALAQIRSSLRGCASAAELRELAEMDLIDCDAGENECETTCGSNFAYVFLPFFVALSNFVIINLVISVLRDEVGRSLHRNKLVVRGTYAMTKKRFALMWHTWRRQCLARTRFLKEIARLEQHKKAEKPLTVSGVAGPGPRFTAKSVKQRKEKVRKAWARADELLGATSAAPEQVRCHSCEGNGQALRSCLLPEGGNGAEFVAESSFLPSKSPSGDQESMLDVTASNDTVRQHDIVLDKFADEGPREENSNLTGAMQPALARVYVSQSRDGGKRDATDYGPSLAPRGDCIQPGNRETMLEQAKSQSLSPRNQDGRGHLELDAKDVGAGAAASKASGPASEAERTDSHTRARLASSSRRVGLENARVRAPSFRRQTPPSRTWERGEEVAILNTESNVVHLQPAQVLQWPPCPMLKMPSALKIPCLHCTPYRYELTSWDYRCSASYRVQT